MWLLQVKVFSETRWVERHTNLTELLTIYDYVLESLETMSGSDYDTDTSVEARGLRMYLTKSETICSLVIAEYMLGFTKMLSIKLQGMIIYDL